MARRIATDSESAPTEPERVLEWRYSRFTRPLATDPPERGEAVVERIAAERKRLDRTGAPLAERLDALTNFVVEMGYPGIARQALASTPPADWQGGA